MKTTHYFLMLLAVFLLNACSRSNDTSVMVPASGNRDANTNVNDVIAIQKKHDLYSYPELTYVVRTDNVQAVAKKVKDNGGRVLYDPNFANGNDIKFVVVNLPPEKLNDVMFVNELKKLNAHISLDSSYTNPITVSDQNVAADDVLPGDVKVPIEDVKLDALRARFADQPVKALGENITVAVIDTGIDASHPVFQNRVTYWADQTQETKTSLKEEKVAADAVKIGEFIIPEKLRGIETLYTAEVREDALRAQVSAADLVEGVKGLDINRNGTETDKYFVLVAKVENQVLAYLDTDGNGEFSEKELSSVVSDFNEVRNKELAISANGFAKFPSRNRTIAYPLLISKNESGNPSAIELGIDLESHGTHVAGIIGGNGAGIQGAAPEVKFIAEKVCSGITCTEAAILRGLVDAFYNPYGIIPDVVNISLGSHEPYEVTNINLVIRDLASKFGAVFFISASNSGPGYHSLNHIGSMGPAIQVGAHVSKKTLGSHYALNTGDVVPDHNLLSFTSLGPSYTGQMRPNIVAPGSAISSVPMIAERSAMYNGTSMAAPIAAGSAAAMLSVAYTRPELESILKTRKAKLANMSAGTDTLIGLPLSVRTSLENSAFRLAQHSMASQGYGLIDINAAYDEFLRQAQRVSSTGFNHFDVVINGNDGERRLYDRNVDIATARSIELAIVDDGEVSEASLLKFQNTPVVVKLEKVEIQNTDGSVTQVTENVPIGLGMTGLESEPLKEISVNVTAKPQKTFLTLRKVNVLRKNPGKTYLAHYTISQQGYREMSFLDVVHVPIEFSEKLVDVDVPSLDVRKEIVGAYVNKGQSIAAMAQHRYPIAINRNDTILNVQMAHSPDQYGRLSLKIYDPDGVEVFNFSTIQNVDINSPKGKISVSTIDKETGLVQTGVYEVVIHSANSYGITKSKYDLVMYPTRLVPTVKEIKVSSEGKQSMGIMAVNSDAEDVKAEGTYLIPTVRLNKIPVQPHYWTYRKLNLGVTGTQTLQMKILAKEGKEISGRIDSVLYRRKADGSFEPTTYELTGTTPNGTSIFTKVLLTDDNPLYVALEVYDTVHDGKNPSENSASVAIDVMVPSMAQTKLTTLTDSGLNGQINVTVTAPLFEVTSTPKDAENFLSSAVKVSLGDAILEIPVSVTAVEAARGLLK